MWICINKLDQAIWLAKNYKWVWYFNLFSMTRINLKKLYNIWVWAISNRLNPFTPEFLKWTLPPLYLDIPCCELACQSKNGKPCRFWWSDGLLWAILSGCILFANVSDLIYRAEMAKAPNKMKLKAWQPVFFTYAGCSFSDWASSIYLQVTTSVTSIFWIKIVFLDRLFTEKILSFKTVMSEQSGAVRGLAFG